MTPNVRRRKCNLHGVECHELCVNGPGHAGNRPWKGIARWFGILAQSRIGAVHPLAISMCARYRSLRPASGVGKAPLVLVTLRNWPWYPRRRWWCRSIAASPEGSRRRLRGSSGDLQERTAMAVARSPECTSRPCRECLVSIADACKARGGTVRLIEATAGMEKHYEAPQRLGTGRG
jgi:hypothetical protein